MKRVVLSILFAMALVVSFQINAQSVAELQNEVIKLEQQLKASGSRLGAAEDAAKKAKPEEVKQRQEEHSKALKENNEIAAKLRDARKKLEEAKKAEGISSQETGSSATGQSSSQASVEQQKPQQDIAEESITEQEEPQVVEEPTKEEQVENTQEEEKTPNSWWKYLLAMIGISALCSGCVFYILNKKIDDLKSMLKADNQSTQRMLNQRLDNLAVKTDRIETSVGSVRQDIRNRDRIVANEPQRPTPSYGPAAVQPSQPKRSTEFYLSMPSIDGSWNDVSTVNKPGQCLYVLNSPDGINGTFRVINEPVAVQSILMAVGKYLSPVCRVTNTATQVSGIVTDEPGVAVFENGIWRMTKKAVVHYV